MNKTAECFNNIVFILLAKISSQKVCEKMENNLTLEKVLLAVAVSRSNFWFQSGFSQKDEKEKLENSEIFCKKKVCHFLFYFLLLLTFELSNINWKCAENWNMLTERAYDSAVFKIFFNIITICIFIVQ